MAKRNDNEFTDNLSEIQTIFDEFVPGGVEVQARFLHRINKTINKDDLGRVYLNQYALALRRKCIVKSFNGNNVRELSETFNVSEQTIRNDIKEYYASQRGKGKAKGLNFLAICKKTQQ